MNYANEVESLYGHSTTKADFIRGYFRHLADIFSKISEHDVAKFIDLILDARERGSYVYFMGNGGSAATASHFMNDIAIGTRTRNKPFKIVSLTDNVSVITALANDVSYEDIFVKQLRPFLKSDDIVVAISASGNSPNVLKAIEYANQLGCVTVGLTGFSGGKLKQITKLALHVPTEPGEYGPVEDVHMIFDHAIAGYLALYCKQHDY